MPTLEQTTQEVLNLATTHFKLAPGALAPEDDFFKKLGIDSLQTLELLSGIESHAGRRLFRRRPRQHHHDQSVQVADLRLRHFLHRWRPRPARLQTHAIRT